MKLNDNMAQEFQKKFTKRLEAEFTVSIKPLFLEEVIYYGHEYYITDAKPVFREPKIENDEIVYPYDWELTLSKGIGENVKIMYREDYLRSGLYD